MGEINERRVDKGEAEAKQINDEILASTKAQAAKSTTVFNIDQYAGTYRDNWFGDIVISNKNGKAWFESKRSPKLNGEIFPYKGNTLIVRWTDRSMDADAYLMFTTDMDGKPSGLTMKAISPLTDFSFDFHDLDLKRVK